MEVNPLTVQIGLGGVWFTTLFIGISITLVRYLWTWKFPLPARLLWGYFLLQALFILEYPALHFDIYTTAYRASAGQAFVAALFIPLVPVLFGKNLIKLIPYLAGLSLIGTWFNLPMLLGAGSFNSAFAAAAIPFCHPWLSIFTVFTVATHHGSTAALIICAQFAAMIFFDRDKKSLQFYGVMIAFLIGAAYLNSGRGFNSDERLAEYARMMRFWLYHVEIPYADPIRYNWRYIFFGVGPGTFTHTSLMLNHYQYPYFLQMHSDWLQLVWSIGLVGLGLAVWVFTAAVRAASGNLSALGALFGCAAFCLTYHPNEYFPSAVLTVLSLAYAFSCKLDLVRVPQSY